ncbi:premnaspirodiene oxygenase-like [Nicotiana tabacum]|uniref:Premnaspirodiene oxygenase-like n=1 Tax=Nicotiana tabacum TaxID=4097 RepID=A0AC58STH0_TOBAC
MESVEFGMPITNQNIKAVIFDMFMAGAETSSTTLIWVMAELIRNPSVMAKAQREEEEYICAGMLFGLANAGYPLAQLLYHFDWKLPANVSLDDFDMIETQGVTASRKNDFCLIATPFGLS